MFTSIEYALWNRLGNNSLLQTHWMSQELPLLTETIFVTSLGETGGIQFPEVNSLSSL